jgi:molybdopterin biosynthesis enzyme
VGDEVFHAIFHPVARRLLDRCDGVLRVGGASAGADEMVRRAATDGKPVFRSVDELPAPAAEPCPA